MTAKQEPELSDCHLAPIFEDESTSYLICAACHNVCDPLVYPAKRDTLDYAVQTNAVAWVIGILDELHIGTMGSFALTSDTTDRLLKGLKNTIRDRYKAQTGVDPAPDYPIHADLLPVIGKKVKGGGQIADPLRNDPDAISLCNACWCMTHTTSESRCGKCGAIKPESGEVGNE